MLHNSPLLLAISSQSLTRLQTRGSSEFDLQWLSNTAWSFSRLTMRSQPLFEAISAVALHRCDWRGRQEDYALLWSLWRVGDPGRILGEMRRRALAQGCSSDPLVQ